MNKKRLKAIKAIPPTIPQMERWCSPYFSAVGNNSSSEIKIMMPDTDASTSPLMVGDQNGIRKR